MDLGDAIKGQLDAALKRRGRVTVLIAGRSGVGKSTLINAVFQGNLAETGQGRPVTKDAREFTKEGVPLSIIDTRGLEMDRFKDTLKDLEELLVRRKLDPDVTRHVHVAWMCISEDSSRVEEGESTVAEMIAKHVPLVAVITKARSDPSLRFMKKVEELLPNARCVRRVRALGEVDDDGHRLDPKGLIELVDATMEVVPEGQRNAFAAAQKVSIQQKKNRGHAIVVTAAASAAGIGAAPIPFADTALLVPLQIGMLAGISLAFGLNLTAAFLGTLLSSAGVVVGGVAAGPAIVGSLLKLIPGAGTLVGGLISATVAATITTAFGEAYIAALARLLEKNPDEMPAAEAVAIAFTEELTRERAP